MRNLIKIAFIFLMTGWAYAADQITLTITVTNPVITAHNITINSATRTWTNMFSTDWLQTNSLYGVASTATNLAYGLSKYPLADNPWVMQTNTNTIRLVFPVGVVVSASAVGNWADFLLYTQVVTKAWTIRVPMTVESATNQTNFASMLLAGFAKATNRFQAAWEAFILFPSLAGPNRFTGTNWFEDGWWTNATLVNLASASGILGNLTNGVMTNTILVSPVMTNGVSYSGFRSPGSGSLSEQIGSSASATGVRSTVFGSDANAAGGSTVAIGWNATASHTNAVAIGASAEVDGTNGVAIGRGASAMATDAISLGQGADVGAGETNSIAIGRGVETTETNQVMLGRADHKVRVPGQLQVTGTITNPIVTGDLGVGASGGPYGSLFLRRFGLTTLADTNNHNISSGSSSYVKVSGPASNFDVTGIQSETGFDGKLLVIQNSTGFSMQIRHENGGSETTNRIYTGTGADFWVTNNPGTVQLIYDAAASRWVVLNASN